MKSSLSLSIAGATVMLALASGAAGAAPVGGSSGKLQLLTETQNGAVEQVHWRGRYWGGRGYWGPRYYAYGGPYRRCWWRHGWRHCDWY